MTWNTGLKAKIGVQGVLHVKRANGETVLIPINGKAPLSETLGITEEQAQEVVRQYQQQPQQEPKP